MSSSTTTTTTRSTTTNATASSSSTTPSSPPSTYNPLEKLSHLDAQKKYTLVFLLSLGTTLLITGASGGRLLKRVKVKTPNDTSRPSTSVTTKATLNSIEHERPSSGIKTGILSKVLLEPKALAEQEFSSTTPKEPSLILPTSELFASPISLPPLSTSSSSSLRKRRRRLLRHWSIPRYANPPPPTTTTRSVTAYFLPNSFISTQSTLFSKQVDLIDRLELEGTLSLPPELPKNFNSALYAAKALGIATFLTFTVFGIGLWKLCTVYEVDDLPSLALALSESLPLKINEHRPELPEWSKPSSSSSPSIPNNLAIKRERTPIENEQDDDNQVLTYWQTIKDTLDREAELERVEKIERWKEILNKREKRSVSVDSERTA